MNLVLDQLRQKIYVQKVCLKIFGNIESVMDIELVLVGMLLNLHLEKSILIGM